MTLPKSCEVEALRVWINALADCDLPESACRSCLATARAVRALLEAKVRETYDAAMLDVDAQCDCDSSGRGSAWVTQDEGKDMTVARVLGAAK